MSPVDQRIHFALVCGAKSCPPIKVYDPTSLEEGLESATVAFCEGMHLHLHLVCSYAICVSSTIQMTDRVTRDQLH